jgi:hypothetical protein
MKILLGDYNEKVGRENIFKPTIGNETLHQGSNDNGVRIVIDFYAVLAGFGTSGVLSPSSCPSVCPRISTRPPLDGFS